MKCLTKADIVAVAVSKRLTKPHIPTGMGADQSRSRNAGYPAPPAQPRTCGFAASGSSVVLAIAQDKTIILNTRFLVMGKTSDIFALYLFVASLMAVAFIYGVFAYKNKLFPVPQVQRIINSLVDIQEATGTRLPWYHKKTTRTTKVTVNDDELTTSGLIAISTISADNEMIVQIIDRSANIIHEWKIDWFRIWPNPDHLKDDIRPRSRPGTHIHGMVLLDDGDLVFNFEGLGLVRLNSCGEVVWRLPYRTHHSIHLDESGNFWVAGQITYTEPLTRLPNYKPPFEEFTILEVSPNGQIITEISVSELIQENGLSGLLYLSTRADDSTLVSGDTLHLNDVETFPSSLASGVFERGDIMISLRNINTIIVFNKEDRKIKFQSTGHFLRQHDPDFIDGNTISLFDNNNLYPQSDRGTSRIVSLSAEHGGHVSTVYSGTVDQPFYSSKMGKHQLFSNGNILITESMTGRAFEINRKGNVVWEYFNLVDDGLLAYLSEAQKLPGHLSKEFFNNKAKRICQSP